MWLCVFDAHILIIHPLIHRWYAARTAHLFKICCEIFGAKVEVLFIHTVTVTMFDSVLATKSK
jgi:hypothetical protein